jgi:hypothetical protein
LSSIQELDMPSYHKLITVAFAILSTGCSSFDIDRSFLKSRTLEADERMLLVTNQGVRKISEDGKVTFAPNNRVVCAEPSPDAMTALAASGTLKGTFGTEGVEASGAFAQAVGELGERTPVVQLLRDSLFRSCEAYMNGLLDEDDYYDILVFFDVYSTTLLGIESLTRTSRSPVIVQTSSNSSMTTKTETQTEKPKKTEESKGESEAKGNSNPVGTLIATGQHSDKVAEKVFDIIKEYYKSKAILFYLLEAKKLYKADKISVDQYIKMITNVGATQVGTLDRRIK